MNGRRYWYRMTYGCDICPFSMPFYLEEGCEGPREQVLVATVPAFEPWERENKVEVDATATGRKVVPVPLIAGPCPACRVGVISHVRWQEDRKVEPDEAIPALAGRFHYPTPDEFKRRPISACGKPLYVQPGNN